MPLPSDSSHTSRERLLDTIYGFWSKGVNNMAVVINDARAAKWLSLGTLVLAGLGVVAAGYVVLNQLVGGSSYAGTPRTVTVLGTGSKAFKPAKAEVSFTYIYQDLGRETTESAGDQKFSSIIQGLNQFQPIEVAKTTPQIVESSSTPSLNAVAASQARFQYVNAARITAGNPELIRDVVAYLYSQGATTVTQVRYLPENEDQANAELRELAVKDAKDKAMDLVKAAGGRVGKVVNIQEGSTPSQTGGTVIDSSANLAGIPSATGDIELESVVTITFEVK